MTCTVSLCAVCRMAGLAGCPARGAQLPLVAAERPKVIYRGHVWYSEAEQRVVWSKSNDPTNWDPA